MLLLSDKVKQCYERAALAHERADNATDPILKDEYLEMERKWVRLAESYRVVEQVRASFDGVQRSRGAGTSPSDEEIEQLAERIVGDKRLVEDRSQG